MSRKLIFTTAIIATILCIGLIITSLRTTSVYDLLGIALFPIGKNIHQKATSITANPQKQKLENRNITSLQQTALISKLQSENNALHDQFQIANPHPSHLLPAEIVNMPGLI